MRDSLRQVTVPLAGHALLALGNGLCGTLLSLRMVAAGYTPAAIGAIQAMYYAGLAVGSLVGAQLVHRLGHGRAYAAFAALAASTALLYPLLDRPLAWALLRALAGYAIVGLFIVTESWLAGASGNAKRGRVFSLYLVVNFLGLGGGQFLLCLGGPGGTELFNLVAMLYMLAPLPVTQAAGSEPDRHPDTVRLNIVQLMRCSPLGFLACLVAGATSGAYHAMAPVHAAAIGLHAGEIAVFMGVTIACGLALQWPVGWMSDRHDRRSVLIAVTGLAAACGAALAWLAPSPSDARWVLSCVYTAATFTLYGLATSIANDRIAARHAVAASGLLLLVFALGASVGPPLAALAMQRFGSGGLYGFAAIATGALGLASAVSLAASPTAAADERVRRAAGAS